MLSFLRQAVDRIFQVVEEIYIPVKNMPSSLSIPSRLILTVFQVEKSPI